MGPIGTQLTSELRRRWGSALGHALLIGLVAAAVLASIAGARRSETAYDRYLAEANAEDVQISFIGPSDPLFPDGLAAVAAIPQVEAIAVTAPMIAIPEELPAVFQDLQAGIDAQFLYETNVPRLIAGRLPAVDRADEVLLNRAAAQSLGLEVGDTLTLRTATLAGFSVAPTELGTKGVVRALTVTGIGVLPGEVVPIAPYDGAAGVFFSPAYFAAHPDEVFDYSYLHIRLHGGAADVAAFRSGLSNVLVGFGIPVQYVPFIDSGARQAKVNAAIEPQAQALRLFAVLLAVVGMLVLGRLFARHLLREVENRRHLWSLGFTRSQLLVVAASRIVVTLVAATIITLAVAIVSSQLFPIGPARLAERHPGVRVNYSVLALGIAVMSALVLIGGLLSVARSLPRMSSSPFGAVPMAASSPSKLAALVAGVGAPPPAVLGVRHALERGRSRNALPVVGALVATTLATSALIAALTFGDNLQRLVATPSLYGQNWDIAIGIGFLGIPLTEARAVLDANPDVAAWSAGNIGELALRAEDSPDPNTLAVPTIGIDTFDGDVYPRIVEGRQVRHRGEIVVGRSTATRLGVDIDDFVVTTTARGEQVTLEVVGLAVFPGVGRAIFDSTDLAEGATVVAELLDDPLIVSGPYTTFLVRYNDGTDQHAANQRLRDQFREFHTDCQFELCIITDQQPGGVRNYEQVRSTPLLLASVFALLAVTTFATTMATSIRQRWRDFAVLRALGFARWQVSATTAWQAATAAMLSAAIGIPIGVVGGRALWAAFDQRIGAEVPAQMPVAAVLIAIPTAVLVANVVAFVPGRRAARVNAAHTLRSE